jgi:hypothetical protein
MKTLLSIGLISALALTADARGDDKPTEEINRDKNVDRPEPFNVKNQLHARYVSGGQKDERKGGWGPSCNFPHALAADDKFGEPGKLSVVVAADESVRLGKFEGVRLRVVIPRSTDFRRFRLALTEKRDDRLAGSGRPGGRNDTRRSFRGAELVAVKP